MQWLSRLPLGLLVAAACGGSATSLSETSLISARPATAEAHVQTRGPCSEVYVQGDRGRYRATGCGEAETYVCNADISTPDKPIECAREFTSRAMSLRYQWRRAQQNESYFWPKVSGVRLGRGTITGSGLSYGSVETVGARTPGAPAMPLPAPQ